MPDVLFLDIEMPGTSGFELAATVKKICSNVIYLTNYMKYGPDSYKHEAIYFIDKERIEELLPEAIAKLKAKLNQGEKKSSGTHKLQRLSILGNREIILFLFDGKEKIELPLELSVESNHTLSKFIFFKKLISIVNNENRYINQKQDTKVFSNLSHSKTNFIKDVNTKLYKHNIILSQKDFFTEVTRGKYTFALSSEKIDLPTDADKLKSWQKISIQPLADLLKLSVKF